MNRKEVFMRCLKRWNADDEKIFYFKENFDEWFSQIPEDICEVVAQLLEMFEYFSQKKINRYLHDLRFKLEEKAKFDSESTIYTPLPSSKGIENSSYDYLFTYRQLHNISKFKLALNLETYIEKNRGKYGEIKNIVIVDDFCGSGESLKAFIKQYSHHLQGKTIYYLVTYFMREALTLIGEVSKQYGVSVEVIYIKSGGRAFDDDIFREKQAELRALIKKQSKTLNIPKIYGLGKYNSESLVSFYNDTPNNTIGLFWYDSDNYFSIFPREFENTEGLKRPTPQSLKEQKGVRCTQNYLSAMRRAQNE